MKLREIYPAANQHTFRAMARENIFRAAWLHCQHIKAFWGIYFQLVCFKPYHNGVLRGVRPRE